MYLTEKEKRKLRRVQEKYMEEGKAQKHQTCKANRKEAQSALLLELESEVARTEEMTKIASCRGMTQTDDREQIFD